MKKFVLLNLVLLLAATMAFAGNSKAEMFSYDKKQVQSEFAQLNQLEKFVNAHEGASLNEIKTFNDAPALAGFNSQSPMSPMFDFDDMEWVPFAWGFLCCPVGFFVVAINDSSSKDEKTSFWIGAIASAVINATWNIIVWTSTSAAVSTTP